MRRFILYTWVFTILLSETAFSQYYLSIVSGGKNLKVADEILSAAEDIEQAILNGIKIDLNKMNTSYSPDSVNGIRNIFYSLYERLNQESIALVMIIGPWLKINNNPELSTLDSNYPDKVNFDYLYNYLTYLKCDKSFIFVITPPGTVLPDLPEAVNWKNLDRNGKYLIVFNSLKPDIDDLVSAFEDTFSDLADEAEKLTEQKKVPLISDWVRSMGAAGAKYGLDLKIYPAGEAKNPYMKLKEN